jgi:hypothetical protein
MMEKKRGYQTAVNASSELQSFAADLSAMSDLKKELFEKIRKLPTRRVTRAELKRDLGYTETGLRLLEQSKWLKPEKNGGRRETYDLHTVLRAATEFPGFATAPTMRTKRKNRNITTVLRDTFLRVVGDHNES